MEIYEETPDICKEAVLREEVRIMNKHSQFRQKNAGLLGAICGSLLIGIPLSSLPGVAEPVAQVNQSPCTCPQSPVNPVSTPGTNLPGRDLTPNRIVPADAPTTPSTVVNPRPSIFNELPYNRIASPTPLGATSADPTFSPGLRDQTNPPVQPPLPEERSEPVAKVMPTDGQVDVKLKNNTNAVISYEAIQYTERRFLPGGEEIVLQDLPTPVTITLVRQDEGLLKVTPISTSEQGLLEVSLDEEKTLDDNQGTLRIQKDGQVFLN